MDVLNSCNSTIPLTSLLFNRSDFINCSNFTFLVFNDSSHYESPFAETYAVLIYCAIFLFLGVPGNIMVFYVVGYCKRKRNSGDIYILSLACADLLCSIAGPILFISKNYPNLLFDKLGDQACDDVIGITIWSSSWTLVLIAADRLRVTSRPMAKNFHKRYLYRRIAITWLVPVGCGVLFEIRIRGGSSENLFTWYIIDLLCSAWIPCIIVTYVYYLTARSLKINTFKHDNSRAMKKRNKQNARALKMFAICTIAFYLCIIPRATCSFIAILMIFFDISFGIRLVDILNARLYLIVFSYANGCINPLIYAKMHREVNRFLRGIMKNFKNCHCKVCSRRSKNAFSPPSACLVSTPIANQSTAV